MPSEVLNVVVSLMCRLTFDFAMWSETTFPITIVCEEAQPLRAADRQAGFEPAKRALSADRQGGTQIWRIALRRDATPLGARTKPAVGMQHDVALRMTNHDDQDISANRFPKRRTA